MLGDTEEPDYVAASRTYQRAYYLKHRAKKLAYARGQQPRANELKKARRIAKGLPTRGPKLFPDATSRKEYNRLHHMERRSIDFLKEKIKVLQIISGLKRPECCKCGCRDIRVLTINHINGGGAAERKRLGRNHGRTMRLKLMDGTRSPQGLDVRCANCNVLHEYERGRSRMPRGWGSLLTELTE